MTFTWLCSILFFIPSFSPTCYLDNTEEGATWVNLPEMKSKLRRVRVRGETECSCRLPLLLEKGVGCAVSQRQCAVMEMPESSGSLHSQGSICRLGSCGLRAVVRHLGFVPASREREAELSCKYRPSLASVAQSSLWIYARQVLNVPRSLHGSCFCDLLCQMTLQNHYGTWLTDFWSSPST